MTKNKAYCFAGSSYEQIMQTVCIRHQVPDFGFFQSYYNQDLSSQHHIEMWANVKKIWDQVDRIVKIIRF